MVRQRHIVVIGGVSSSWPAISAIDRYIIKLAAKKRPTICFIPTASGDAESHISNFYQAMAHHEVRPMHLPLFKQKGSLPDLIKSADIFYVGGGNTFNMLRLWQAWGLDQLLHTAYIKGKVMAGASAGANCWFEHFLTDSTGDMSMMPGLGWLPGAFSPHYNEPERRPAYRRLLPATGTAGYAADNDAAIHFIDEKSHCFVSAAKERTVYRLSVKAGRIPVEEKKRAVLLKA